MGMNNVQQLRQAESYIGAGGSVFRKFCGLGAGQPYCCAYVVTIFANGGNSALFCNSRKETYCPDAIKWCRENLAQIPIGIAMPSDIIFFDWQPNQIPDHIGFVKESLGAVECRTIEGNTTMRNSEGKVVASGVVAYRTRTAREIQAVFRPHFAATFDISKPLEIDGVVGYQTIAKLQVALGIEVDGILGKETVKALQKKAGVEQDGSWGPATTKAVQALLGVSSDGLFGPESCKALQRWAEANASGKAPVEPDPAPEPAPAAKVEVDGHMGPATVKATQALFGTVQDGEISGQKKALQKYYPAINAVSFGGGGSLVVMRLQQWLDVIQDGILGKDTVKAWQKKLGVTQDGIFGSASCKAWQEFLNENDTVTMPAVTRTLGDQIADTAREWIGKCPYVKGGTDIHKGVDCTGFIQEIYRLNGIKLSNKLSTWGKNIGTDISEALPGDVLTYKDKTGIHHAVYGGNGYVIHAANPKKGIIRSKWNSMSRPLVGIRRTWDK